MERLEALVEISKSNEENKIAYLHGARLQYADLQDADLQYANLQYANLQGARLQYINLQGADLQGADLRGANLQGADLQGADLRGARLQSACLQGAKLQSACLQGANLQGARYEGLILKKAFGFNDLYRYWVAIFIDQNNEGYIRMGCLFKSLKEWEEIGIENSNLKEFPNDGSPASLNRIDAFNFAENRLIREINSKAKLEGGSNA